MHAAAPSSFARAALALAVATLVGCATGTAPASAPASPIVPSSAASTREEPAPSIAPVVGPDVVDAPPAVVAPALPLLPDTAVSRLQRAFAEILRRSAAGRAPRSLLVVDAATSQVLVEDHADDALVPASNAKLFTTAAAVDRLGEDTTTATRLLADAAPDDAGVIDGDLVLDSGDDISWSRRAPEDPASIVDALVATLAEHGVRRVRGVVRAEGLYFVERTAADAYDEEAQRRKARARVLSALRRRRIGVEGAPGHAKSQRVELARIESPPLLDAIEPILRASHNGFADLLFRHLGRATGHDPTPGGGAAALDEWLASAEIPATFVHLADGSGLSRENRATARSLARVLLFLQSRHPRFTAHLAIAGEKGTLSRRLAGEDTRGRVFAKTGTLAEVTALSGYLDNRHDGRRYVFSILLNGVREISAGRRLEDELVTALARSWSAS